MVRGITTMVLSFYMARLVVSVYTDSYSSLQSLGFVIA